MSRGHLAAGLGAKIPVSRPRHGRADSVRRGHLVERQYSEPELWAFAIRIAEHFTFRADWYRQGTAAALVLEYYYVLRSVLRAKPELRACRTQCRHCHIFFLTHPRNVRQRRQMRCPFGCRQAHRKRESVRRSVAYYRDPDVGKQKKAALNQRRHRAGQTVSRATSAAAAGSGKKAPVIVDHVRMVVSLIEGRPIRRWQVLRMLATVLRQHTIVRRRPVDHAVAWLNKRPP